MHRFTIDSSVLGTSKHIVGDHEGFVWSVSVPRDSWHMTGNTKLSSSKCLDTLFRLNHHSSSKIPDRYLTAMQCLITGSIPAVPWQHILPQDEFRLFFKSLVQETIDIFSRLPFSYYETAWLSGSRVLSALRPARIDLDKLQSYQANTAQHIPGLESFRPKRSGFSHPAVYDRFATRTGRLTVIEGPNILVLKKSCRDIITSSFEGGSIISLDFKALEARIVLAETGHYSEEDDIYNDISQKQFGGTLSRDIVKTAVLAELYGISRGSLKVRLGVSDKQLDSFIAVIRGFFKVNELRKRLKDQVGASGKMLNRFERPLIIPEGQDNLLVNSYAQSSGVDVSMIGFDSILQQLGTEGIRPLFVLHDAIIIDVHPDRLCDVEGIKDVAIRGYEKNFPIKFEKVF